MSDPIRIAMVCEGDAESFDTAFSGTAKSIVDSLRIRGHEVVTIDAEAHGWRRYLLAARTYAPNRRLWQARFQLGAQAFLARSRRAAQTLARLVTPPDVIFQIGATFAPPGTSIPIPYVLYCDWNMALTRKEAGSDPSVAPPLPSREAAQIDAREAAVYRRAEIVFTISERLRRSFLEDYQLAPERVCTAYAGPNLDVAAIPPRPQRSASHAPTILFIGKMFHRKGGDILLSAFREVRQAVPTARLLIAGPRDLTLAEPGVENLGFLRKSNADENRRLVQAYLDADVFALPTRYDPFPTVVREAMFFRLPCVTTDIWAMPEMVIDGTTGYTVPVGDPQALAERLIRLLRDPELARGMGEAARNLAEDRFSWPAVAGRIEDGLLGVVNDRRARGYA